ncbi:hypothetical protein OS493_032711 [Desmophyllum pertusum]|uniref:Uncharacterized protein n=1 Tax=Desmophyllum pertusum TaxID=174260 RepID=A0A9W9ZY96_9CNID|nr:hypothetical protein OS493_032711 [Desmophyllum pertusum]
MKKMKQMHLPEKVPSWKKSYSDVNVSKKIEAGRKKIQSARDNMKRWKEQEAGGDVHGANEAEKESIAVHPRPFQGEDFLQRKGQVVSAAAHTTTTDLGGSGTEERSNTEDEIPTRDVDGQLGDTSSNVSRRASHLQIPSSTVESLKKSLQNSKEGRQHRGPLASKFTGHTGAVCGLKVHNGHLFTCSADKTTRSFNIQTGQCVKLYQGHHQAVNCVEASADKDRLFTGSNDQTVRSYNIKSGVCTHKFTFDGRVMCLHAAFDLLFVGLSTGIVASIDLLVSGTGIRACARG